jgi:alanine dehydrogenase
MIIGVLKEVKDHETRVAVTPGGVKEFVSAGHSVLVEHDAGTGSGISNEEFRQAGADISEGRDEISVNAGLILKIKEPQPSEYALFRSGQSLFTFFHFASSRQLTEAMINAQVSCIAYETVETADGRVPLLAPMSEVAGKMAPIVAANCLARPAGGKGVLASSVENVNPAMFVILGGGNAGQAAAAVALGIGAAVVIVEKNHANIDRLKQIFPKALILPSTPDNIETYVRQADALIGTIHIPGAQPPKLVTRKMVAEMEKGSVIVDIAIDQGGCIETSRPTTHSNPIYVEQGVIHYCVTNMPGVFPRTSTFALTHRTLPYALELAEKGPRAFSNGELRKGLNIYKGKVTNRGVAEAHNLPYTDPGELLG